MQITYRWLTKSKTPRSALRADWLRPQLCSKITARRSPKRSLLLRGSEDIWMIKYSCDELMIDCQITEKITQKYSMLCWHARGIRETSISSCDMLYGSMIARGRGGVKCARFMPEGGCFQNEVWSDRRTMRDWCPQLIVRRKYARILICVLEHMRVYICYVCNYLWCLRNIVIIWDYFSILQFNGFRQQRPYTTQHVCIHINKCVLRENHRTKMPMMIESQTPITMRAVRVIIITVFGLYYGIGSSRGSRGIRDDADHAAR